ncbi:hypothetical protein KAFR_0D04450 [Kazachstania africana CBS 2517]|uniref:Mitotic check point protein BFA1 n=1 Tax=Kazachstania africana (strain ATCC 22294 / BCRC 22015 / CBS 2517 / CECT 1963 / NBRC 1671 / NRRL Y-8276) TaxID=1071382 RepID=H2AUP3_KAZAF|nr:hypothetical protein KAFR_0D04450 [Kazachstania africana CBS 2517]CCF58093.1 hypothetical protein KAFR_0D04450 [Kazachstania africana CBS 2517]
MRDVTETSFEDLETSISREQPVQTSSRLPHQLRNMKSYPTPSTGSSNATVFSDNLRERVWSSNFSDGEIGEEDEYLGDFMDFHNKKDNFDKAIRTHLNNNNTSTARRLHSSPTRRSQEFAQKFDKLLTVSAPKTRAGLSREETGGSLRQPKSMMNLHNRRDINNYMDIANNNDNMAGLKSSKSYGSLRNPSRNNNTVRFKKSLSNLIPSAPVIQEQDEDNSSDDFMNDTVIGPSTNREQFLKKFEEDNLEQEDDADFAFDESVLQPQFLSKIAITRSNSKVSTDMYEIEDAENLLTPQLHRQSRQRVVMGPDTFKDPRVNSRKPSGGFIPPTSKIKTIKQQIDCNTPIKRGNMQYNPRTMKWEGNEKVLSTFDVMEDKPLLIRNKKSDSNELENVKIRSNSNNPRVVGNMVFDEKNLRWVSIHEEQADPFAGVDKILNLPKRKKSSPFLRSQSHSTTNRRTASSSLASRKYNTIGGRGSPTEYNEADPAFFVNSRQLEHFYHEENKWNKKVGAWFILGNQGEEDDLSKNITITNHDHKEFMYEIRKMVLNSTRN